MDLFMFGLFYTDMVRSYCHLDAFRLLVVFLHIEGQSAQGCIIYKSVCQDSSGLCTATL